MRFLAAVDGGVKQGVRGTGAVYAVAESAHALEAQILADRIDDGDFDVVTCSAAAASYIAEHGGAPDRMIVVDRNGVRLATEGD